MSSTGGSDTVSRRTRSAISFADPFARLKPEWLVFGLGFLLLLLLSLVHVTQGRASIELTAIFEALFAPQDNLEHNIVRYARLPRLAVGLMAGGALAVAGVLLQAVTRNHLASPATLGVNAGAYLALVAGSLFVPQVIGFSPLLAAAAGGALAALIAYAVASAGGEATPVRLALAGVAVSLSLAATTGVLQLFYENETAGLFLWGAGSLVQEDWSRVAYAAPRLLPLLAVVLLLAPRFDVFRLGDDVAQGLGQNVANVRKLGLAGGVLLAAVAVSVVGPIGFVGLIVPHFMRLLGIRDQRTTMLGAALWGGAMLVGADVAARSLAVGVNELPAGVVTALVGTPFFVWLARRSEAGGSAASGARSRSVLLRVQRQPYPVTLGLGALLLGLIFVGGLLFGDVPISLPTLGQVLAGEGSGLARRVVLELRAPRLLVAIAAGASLGVSGLLFQGVVRNPLAAPSVLGVTSGAGLGGLLLIAVFPAAGVALVGPAALLGGFAAFAVVYLVSWKDGLHPTRMALVGIAVSAFCAAAISLIVVRADVRVASALAWLAGSTYARGWPELTLLIFWPAVLLPAAFLLAPHLDTLALGDNAAKGIGVRIEAVRFGSLFTAVGLAAGAVATVGTISYVGLVTPHAVRLLVGPRQRRLVPLVAIGGGLLVALADTLGRALLAPKEIPSGLVTALIGAPYFVWLLWRQPKS